MNTFLISWTNIYIATNYKHPYFLQWKPGTQNQRSPPCLILHKSLSTIEHASREFNVCDFTIYEWHRHREDAADGRTGCQVKTVIKSVTQTLCDSALNLPAPPTNPFYNTLLSITQSLWNARPEAVPPVSTQCNGWASWHLLFKTLIILACLWIPGAYLALVRPQWCAGLPARM